jgi:putative membrane protein
MQRSYALGELLTQISTITIVLSGLSLIVGVVLIKRGQRQAHMNAMMVACALASIFIVFYLTKVGLRFSKEYIGPPEWRVGYFVLLISHMIMAALNLPLAIMAFINAWNGRKAAGGSNFTTQEAIHQPPAASFFAKHRAWVRWTVPVWLYVAVTGWMIYAVLEQYGRWKA